ncbi:glycosaminoglycan xylosylkinase homolog [Dendroctonus ponderosae]|nr:glycosaminoglycan xylosylkinase homolog [Dendroctonus ponderosae]
MFRKRIVLVVALLVLLVFFCTLQHLQGYLPAIERLPKTNQDVEEAIYEELSRLPESYSRDALQLNSAERFLSNIKRTGRWGLESVPLQQLWAEANSWPSDSQLTNLSSALMGRILYSLGHARITKADLDTRGTQLKILLTLMGEQECVFKPKWYPIEKSIEGPVYAGKDRYGSEIVGFYLSVLLDKPFVPASVERTISLKYDVLPVATNRLLNVSLEKENRSCVFGQCFYCSKEDPICDNEGNLLTGAVIFNVRKSFSSYRSPWQRTYKKRKKAAWEDSVDYCSAVKTRLHKKRLLDLIDVAIFDFLLQNGDRHHYETLDDSIVWLDNGKGLGNPYVQHLDILAPLYQCCLIRKKMWQALLSLAGGALSKYMKLMPDIQNVLTEPHLRAMEQRLRLVFATVEFCKGRHDMRIFDRFCHKSGHFEFALHKPLIGSLTGLAGKTNPSPTHQGKK